MGFFDSISTFWDSNKDWIKPVVSTGIGALQQMNKDDAQSQYLQYLRDRENQNYQNYLTQFSTPVGGGGGGGGSGRAAAAATEANRQVAAKKANKALQKTYKQILGMYAPYKDTAATLLPQMTKTYQDSLGLQNSLMNFVTAPDQMAKLNASVPAWQTGVPVPDWVKNS